MKFFLRYKVNTNFSLGHRSDHVKKKRGFAPINLPMQDICMYELTEIIDSKNVFIGLGFDGYIEANNREEAALRMFNSINLMLSICCYTTLSHYDKLELIEIYEATPDINEREFIYYYYPFSTDDVLKSIRVIDTDLLLKVWTNFENIKHPINLINSTYQINKSLIADSKNDEFLYLWTGLEYISSLLNKKYKLVSIKKYPNCRECGIDITECPNPKCKHKFEKKLVSQGIFAGVKLMAINKIGLSAKKFDEIYKARSQLIHDASGLKGTLDIYISTLQKLLIWGIAEVIDLDQKNIDKILSLKSVKAGKSTDTRYLHIAKMKGLQNLPKIENFSEQPTLELKVKITYPNITVDPDGSVNFKNKNDFIYIAPKAVIFNDISGEFWSNDPSIKKASIDFNKKT